MDACLQVPAGGVQGRGEGGAVGAQAVQLGCLTSCLIPQILQLRIIVSQLAQQLGHPPFQLLRLGAPYYVLSH